MEQYQEYHPKICTQCGGINPGYPVVYSYGEYRCTCLSAQPGPMPGRTTDRTEYHPEGIENPAQIQTDARNQLLDELIAQCQQPPHVVNIDYLKSLKQ